MSETPKTGFLMMGQIIYGFCIIIGATTGHLRDGSFSCLSSTSNSSTLLKQSLPRTQISLSHFTVVIEELNFLNHNIILSLLYGVEGIKNDSNLSYS